MAEEIAEPETELFKNLTRDASQWCCDAWDAKRLGHRDEAVECLRQALERIGRAFLHA